MTVQTFSQAIASVFGLSISKFRRLVEAGAVKIEEGEFVVKIGKEWRHITIHPHTI